MITALSSAAFILVLALLVLPNLLETDANRIRVQRLASQALDREILINGPLDIGFFRGPHLTLNNVHINHDELELLVVNQVEIRVALLPLFTGNFQILSIYLDKPVVSIVRNETANFLPETPETAGQIFDVLEIQEISFNGAVISYTDPKAETSLGAMNCDLQIHQLRLAKGPRVTLLQNLSFNAALFCNEFKYHQYYGSDLNITASASNGILNLDPLTMQLLGGQGSGSIKADFAAATPHYTVHYLLPRFNLADLLSPFSSDLSAQGKLDLSLDLLFQGSTTAALTQKANGTVVLQGADLTLSGIDIDEKLEKFESSQNFDLIDAGAFFFAGPLGLFAAKGSDFTLLLQEADGSSDISSLVSHWVITDGIADAVDVAMSSRENRIAVKGQLDLVNDRFIDVSIAQIDSNGCSMAQQDIDGSFSKPQAGQAQVFSRLVGPVVNILQQGAALFTSDQDCEVFYAGVVQAP